MRTSELKALLKTVQSIRAEKYPELSSEFLEAVVNAEEANADDDASAIREIELALQNVLSRKRTR